jgi:hypothetical protein
MPAQRETIGAAVAQVAAYCEQRSTDDYRIEHTVRGASITIVERRPPWNPDFGSEWSSLKVAPAALRRRQPSLAAVLLRQRRPLAPVRAGLPGARGRAAARRDRAGPHRHLLGLITPGWASKPLEATLICLE